MEAESLERRLVAILSADAVGYSRLMAEDETGTLTTLRSHRAAIGGLVSDFAGRVVDAVGDNLLAEFRSVTDTVSCAIAIQIALERANEWLPSHRQMHFRVGVHVGDVLLESGRIAGDAVNVAARIEALCEPGGVCLSGPAFDHVEGKLDVVFEALGRRQLKNIPRPTRVYQIAPPAGTRPVESQEQTKKPTLLVTALVSLSEDGGDQFLAAGLTEDLNTLVSCLSGFTVMPSLGLAVRKQQPDLRGQGQAEGARYVFGGSVRRRGNRFRVNTRLLDVESGAQLWADRYERDFDELFSVQDEILDRIASTLGTRLFQAEVTRARAMRPYRLDAWQLVHEAIATEGEVYSSENLDRAEALLRKAIALAPDYGLALAALAIILAGRVRAGLSQDAEKDGEEAQCLADQAKSLAPSDARVIFRAGGVRLRLGDPVAAIPLLERSLELDPCWIPARMDLGLALVQVGRTNEGVELLRASLDRAVRDPFQYLYLLALGFGLFAQGDLRGAGEALSRSVKLHGFHLNWLAMALVLASNRRFEEARDALDKARTAEPTLSLERCEAIVRTSARDEAVAARLVATLQGLWVQASP